MKLNSMMMVALLVVGALTAYAGGAIDSTSSKKANTAPPYQILFFMNPNGHPCQMQDAIIKQMGEKLDGLASVKYYKTTENDDYAAFGTYGIRGLPSLIILDQKGKEIKRFTPGIQNAETILGALQLKK